MWPILPQFQHPSRSTGFTRPRYTSPPPEWRGVMGVERRATHDLCSSYMTTIMAASGDGLSGALPPHRLRSDMVSALSVSLPRRMSTGEVPARLLLCRPRA